MFGPSFKPEDCPDMAGKTVIITGASAGIGLENARDLAIKLNATVVMAVRSPAKAEPLAAAIMKEVQATGGSGAVEVMQLDLMSLASVENFAKAFLDSGRPLHVLLLNAGVAFLPYKLTEDNLESQWQTNHVGHFLLTQLLLPRLKEAQPSRVVVVSSGAYKAKSKIPLDNISDDKSYHGFKQYAYTKRANIYFTQELSKRLGDTGIYVNCLHPGAVKTDILNPARGNSTGFRFLTNVFQFVMLDAHTGSLNNLFLAASKDVEEKNMRGLYVVPHQKVEKTSHPKPDQQLELWDYTNKVLKDRLGDRYEPAI